MSLLGKAKRKFTKKEMGIVILIILLIVGLIYYYFIYMPTKDEISQYSTVELEDELMAYELRALKIVEIKQALENGESVSFVADYNNLQNEITELSYIFSKAVEYQFNFDNAVSDGDIVRRNINIYFKARSYEGAKEILEALKNCKYKSLLRNVNITPKDGEIYTSNSVDVTLDMTFFEAPNDKIQSEGKNVDVLETLKSSEKMGEARSYDGIVD